jgi:hypothetical protein
MLLLLWKRGTGSLELQGLDSHTMNDAEFGPSTEFSRLLKPVLTIVFPYFYIFPTP